MVPVAVDTFVDYVRAFEKFDSYYFLVFVDDFKSKFRVEVQSNGVVMVEESDTVFVGKELGGDFIEVESVFEEEVGIDGLCEVFFDVHWTIKYCLLFETLLAI